MSNEDLDEAAEANLDEAEVDEDELDEDVELADDALELDEVEPIVVDAVVDAEVEVEVEVVPDVAAVEAVPAKAAAKRVRKGDEDEDVIDLDEELHPDDIEEPLDAILKERTASGALEEDEEVEEEVEVDERGETATRIVPRRADEFLCSSCFLVVPRGQLADEKRMLCRDCV
jgi:Domain of unknown function (DUF4193)